MTTAIERPAVFTGTPEQILAQLIAAYENRVAGYIAKHLVRRDRQLVEDLTQDTFVHLWRYHVARGTVLDERVFGLLANIARQMICHHLRRLRSHEIVTDFTDPAVAAARGLQGSPLDAPHLASLYADLEAAKTALTEAADGYRVAARIHGNAQTGLGNAVRPEAVERCTVRAAATESAVKIALEHFRVAGERVARVRAEWNAAAAGHAALAGV